MRTVIVLCILLAVGTTARAQDAAVASAFEGFCIEWMHKLEAREQANVTHIKWETGADGVHGEYIGYTQEHTCTMKSGTGNVPVGKIIYREIRYEKRGSSVKEAEGSAAHPVETTEVTEIFRYEKGKWVY